MLPGCGRCSLQIRPIPGFDARLTDRFSRPPLGPAICMHLRASRTHILGSSTLGPTSVIFLTSISRCGSSTSLTDALGGIRRPTSHPEPSTANYSYARAEMPRLTWNSFRIHHQQSCADTTNTLPSAPSTLFVRMLDNGYKYSIWSSHSKPQ